MRRKPRVINEITSDSSRLLLERIKQITPSTEEVPMVQDAIVHIQDHQRVPYAEYLKGKHWLSFRKRVLDDRGYFCQITRQRHNLIIHHNTYARLGHERFDDVVVMRADIHAVIHAYMKNPEKFTDLINGFNENDD